MIKATSIAIAIFTIILIFAGCSNNQNPLVTGDFFPSPDDSSISATLDTISGPQSSGTFIFDKNAPSATVILDRSEAAHYNVSMRIPYPIVNVISYDSTTQIIEADVTIKNNRTIDVSDVRLIIFNDNNETELLNPDDWTNAWDIPGGNDINPFMAYAKSEPNRKFAGLSEYTERLRIYIPAGVNSVRWAIDASFPGNCAEPYSIENVYQATLYDYQDAVTPLYVDVLDWQGDVSEVALHAPEVTNELLSYFSPVNSIQWKLDLTNRKAVPAGDYPGVIRATSTGGGKYLLYDYITIKVAAYAPVKWTIFYYAYEENLYGVRDNINEMEVVGSVDGSFNMVVLWDETGTVEDHIMKIQKDPGGYNDVLISPSIDDHHEVIPPDGLNMRDPDTVTRFLRYAMREFPAENFGFIMLSHGNGGVYTFPPDKNFLDDMGVWEFREAAKIAFDENPFVDQLEFIGLESCTMSFLEWAYGMKDLAKVGWASEFVMWLSSARYDQVLSQFLSHIDTYNGHDFATLFVNNACDNGGAVTYGAWDSDHIDPLVIPALNTFAQALIDYLPTHRLEIEACRAGSDNWGNECTDFRITDLGYFCENIMNYNPPLPDELTSKAALLRQAIADSFFVRRVKNPGPGCYHGATGWEILFTDRFNDPSLDYADVRNRIQLIGFADATLWDEFLTLYDDNDY